MTQTVPATAVLGPGATGLTIGYRVLNLDGTEYSAFTTDDVAETSTAGTYRKAGGVVAPLAGGYIVWGTALVDYAEATVDSTAVNVTYSAGVALSGRLAEAVDLPSEPLDATATQAAAAAALTAYDPPTKTEMDAGFTALNDLDAAGIRLAVGLATANLDMQLSTIDGIVDDLALVAPDNKPIVNVDGETLAYMTALSEEEIAAAVVVALQETPVEVICITPQPSQESDYDILRNNATNC